MRRSLIIAGGLGAVAVLAWAIVLLSDQQMAQSHLPAPTIATSLGEIAAPSPANASSAQQPLAPEADPGIPLILGNAAQDVAADPPYLVGQVVDVDGRPVVAAQFQWVSMDPPMSSPARRTTTATQRLLLTRLSSSRKCPRCPPRSTTLPSCYLQGQVGTACRLLLCSKPSSSSSESSLLAFGTLMTRC